MTIGELLDRIGAAETEAPRNGSSSGGGSAVRSGHANDDGANPLLTYTDGGSGGVGRGGGGSGGPGDGADNEEALSLYLYDVSIPRQLPSLLDHLRIPRYFAHDYLRRTMHKHPWSLNWPSLFVGAAGTSSSLHVDQWFVGPLLH